VIATKHGANQARWKTAEKEKPFDLMRHLVIIETKAEVLLKVLAAGTVSMNVFLRRLHNFRVDMNWLPWPIIPKRQWPVVRFKEKRAITFAEHQRIVDREKNPERKAFYQLAWGTKPLEFRLKVKRDRGQLAVSDFSNKAETPQFCFIACGKRVGRIFSSIWMLQRSYGLGGPAIFLNPNFS